MQYNFMINILYLEDPVIKDSYLVLVEVEPFQVPQSDKHVLGEIGETITVQLKISQAVEIGESVALDPMRQTGDSQNLLQFYYFIK